VPKLIPSLPIVKPRTLEEALEYIANLEAQNTNLITKMKKKNEKHEKLTNSLSRIGDRILGACDKVHVVMNEHDQRMMEEQMTAMETLVNVPANFR